MSISIDFYQAINVVRQTLLSQFKMDGSLFLQVNNLKIQLHLTFFMSKIGLKLYFFFTS